MKQSFITKFYLTSIQITAWKVSKYGVISGPITGKYGPEITPYLDTFRAAFIIKIKDINQN